jgi:hypothetical protein
MPYTYVNNGGIMMEHFIDFWVIFFADVAAAYVAIKVFEARHVDRDRTERSLSKLYQLTTGLKQFYWRERGRVSSIAIQFEARISGDLNADREGFEELQDNLLFWSFRSEVPFHEKYTTVRSTMAQAHQSQNAGELKVTLDKLLDELKKLTDIITQELKPKPPTLRFWK